jgi:transposase
MRGRTFTREFKLDVVRQVASGAKRPAQVCREHQLGESLLARWRREYEERGEAAFAPRALDAQASQAGRRHQRAGHSRGVGT